MLKQAHEVMEKAGALASTVKDESWGDAERILLELQSTLDTLGNHLREKVRAEAGVPTPDRRDRG